MPNTNLLSELLIKKTLIDSDIIVVEDSEDTKQSTIENLKKNFNGDAYDPNNLKFFSSAKVNEIKQSLQKEITAKASHSEMTSLKKAVNTIITTQSEQDQKDIELIIARDSCTTLKDRLDRDKASLSSRSLSKYKRSITGTRVYLGDYKGYGDVLVDSLSSGRLVVASCNYFNINHMYGMNTSYMTYSNYGFTYNQKLSDSGVKQTDIHIPLTNIPTGTYYFSANMYNNTTTNKNGESVQFKIPTTVKVLVNYVDHSIDYIDLAITENNSNLFYFTFTANRTLSSIDLKFSEEDFIEESTLVFDNVMVTPQKMLNEYIEHEVTYYTVSGKQYVNDVKLHNCEVYFEGFGAEVTVDYYNDEYDTEYLVNNIQAMQKNLYEGLDHCGLSTNYGLYNFLTMENTTNKNTDGAYIEVSSNDKYLRNNNRSMQVYFTSYSDATRLIVNLDETPSDMKHVTLLWYLDKYISYYLEEDAVTVYLVSDYTTTYPPNNYYKRVIPKGMFIQGWNSTKLAFNEFETVGSPNVTSINSVMIEFTNNVNTVNKSIYINSIIFNQSVQPTVLLGFNGVYDNTFTYTLPMLKNRELPCSIFLNNSSTLTKDQLDALVMYRLEGLDIGQYGCNPNKEVLLEDTNYREQYLALKYIRDYLQANMVYSPMSYSAPYGNLRPITSSMLDDLGYHIAKTGEEESYCSFFSKYDQCIPSIEINNESDVQYIKDKIDYIIDTGQIMGISTYNVTEYGDEMNAKKSMFEEIMNYLQERYELNQLNVMSYKAFYDRCVK